MSPLLASLRTRGYFAALDVELARALGRVAEEANEAVLLAVALASRRVRDGHVCADLAREAGQPIADPDAIQPAVDETVHFPELSAWRKALRDSPLVGDESQHRPLVLDAHDRLYLFRYFDHERALAERLSALATPIGVDESATESILDRLFGPASAEIDRQRLAAGVAARRRLTVVSGGPGTGKTSAVVKILALLAELSAKPLEALLLAPTGKAAARLSEAVERARTSLDVAESIRAKIPASASTIHRALGPIGSDRGRFRHDRNTPLAADAVVVDESSMVDVPLLRRLLDAVPDSARVILLGDAHQLASVEAGAALGDICAEADPKSPLGESIVVLEKSYRFDERSGIGNLAAAIKAGDTDRALEILRGRSADASLIEAEGDALERALAALIAEGYLDFTRARSPGAALVALERFRVLAAHRRGPQGVEALNALAERALATEGLLDPNSGPGRFYRRRPLMVIENDYRLGLYNGDVGVVFPATDGSLRVFFGEQRALSPSRVPPHETVFATSIHRSQGSEFDTVAIVLPEPRSLLLTRELLYTAVTRARRRVVLLGSAESVSAGIARRGERVSGLRDRLRA